MTTTMKAAVLEAHGAPLAVRHVPRPTPAPGEVLVRVAAAGLNPLDLKILAGAAPHAKHPAPAILGIDLAGVVEVSTVPAFAPGDEVYGMTGGVGGVPGSLAEYAAVDARLLARKPARLSMREAAALPLVAITAWEGLVDRAQVQAGQTVLVMGAGGVGRVVIQLAIARGAQVWAVDRAAKAPMIEGLGATALTLGEPLGRDFDVVYDTVGGAALDAAFAAVRRFGHVVSCLGWGTHALGPLSFRAATYSGVFTLLPLLTGEGRAHHGEILREVAALVEAGALRPQVDPRRFTLDMVGAAFVAAERAKIVVDLR